MGCAQVALLSPYMQREVLHHGRGCARGNPIVLPSKVTPEILALLLTYCRFHRATGRSDKARQPPHEHAWTLARYVRHACFLCWVQGRASEGVLCLGVSGGRA